MLKEIGSSIAALVAFLVFVLVWEGVSNWWSKRKAISSMRKLTTSSTASKPDEQSNNSGFWKAMIITFVVGIVALLAIRFMGLFLALGIYSSVFQSVKQFTHLPDMLAGAVSVVLVSGLVFLLFPYLSKSFFGFRDPKRNSKLFLVGIGLSVGMVAVFFVSQPGANEYFSPITGDPMYKYSTGCGRIELFPLGYQFDPHSQEVLLLITPSVAKAYSEQESPKAKALAPLPAKGSSMAKEIANARGDNKRFKSDPKIVSTASSAVCAIRTVNEQDATMWDNYGPFVLWVEYVNLTSDNTIIGVAVKLQDGFMGKRRFHQFSMKNEYPKEYARLVDSNGLFSKIESDDGVYPIELKSAGYRSSGFWGGGPLQWQAGASCLMFCDSAMMFFPGETYHFKLRFAKLLTYWPDFRLEVPHFNPIRIFFVE